MYTTAGSGANVTNREPGARPAAEVLPRAACSSPERGLRRARRSAPGARSVAGATSRRDRPRRPTSWRRRPAAASPQTPHAAPPPPPPPPPPSRPADASTLPLGSGDPRRVYVYLRNRHRHRHRVTTHCYNCYTVPTPAILHYTIH